MLHGIDEGQVIQRRDQIDIAQTGKQFIHWLLHIRIQMNGIDNVHFRVKSRQFFDRFADMQETISEVLATMSGDEDILTITYRVAFLLKFLRHLFFHTGGGGNDIDRHQQGIDHRISGNKDFLRIYILLQQICP